MPRLVRKAPLSERIKAYLDPYDFLLWLSETLNDDALGEWLKDWATIIGIGLNIVFILARGASKSGSASARDDVFGDIDGSESGWLSWCAMFLVYVLTLFCCWNAFETFFRKRHYRLFEQPVDEAPATPSAHRVRVDSTPSSSPLRYLQNAISSATASSRAYPDPEREVWEVSMWDPRPFQLTIFTLFSPGHLILYYSLLPPARMDPRPSISVLTAMLFGTLLSLQLGFLRSSFSQQAKDSTLIHGEVMNEYDTKFVRPSLNRPVRDVGTQTRLSTLSPHGKSTREVELYTPTTLVHRAFRTHPNPNYASQYDPDNLASKPDSRRTSDAGVQHHRTFPSTPTLNTPSTAYAQTTTGHAQSSTYSRQSLGAAAGPDYSSPLKPHHERRSGGSGDGGSLGVYSHAASPLRKAASSSQLGGGSRDGAANRPAGAGSPLKRFSTPGGGWRMNGGSGVGGSRAGRRETGRF